MKSRAKSTLWLPLLASGLFVLLGPVLATANDCRSAPAAGSDWQGCDKKLLMLGGSDLKDARLGEADFSATDLRAANLVGANLEKARLVRATLAGVTATGTSFARVEAYRTDFSGMSADDASFESAELQRSNFRNSRLSNANFTKADLGRSQFDGAELGGSRFSLANLARADFRGASFSAPLDFDRAFFFLTRIEGVDLSSSTGVSQWQLDMACGNAETVLPDGLKTPPNWPCKFEQD
ncbi:MAG: pentapeptide repeat-containing protein [Rhizobium sp.]|nr:pentapeptide repeat-containing protein [Rhizobium sp.]